MIHYFAAHPTASNILLVVIILLGTAVLPTLNKETFPQIQTNQVQVTVPYPGASPSEVEEGICNRLEDATDGLSFLEEQRCEARDSVGMLTLDMQEAGDIKQFVDDVNAAVDSITEFPEDAEDPVVVELGRTDNVVGVAISTDLTPPELKDLAEYYRSRLLALPEVPIVTVTGFSTHELRVLVKPETLRQYQLSVQDIAHLIKAQAVDLPAGTVEATEQRFHIRFKNERRTSDQLADLVILHNERGGQLLLGDIATIVDDFSNEEKRTELNGRPAAILQISKNTTDDTLTVFNAVQAFVAAENERLPDNTRLVMTQDRASIVQDRLSLLLRNGWQGLILAMAVLWMFFTWRYTFWVALGLPMSFLGGLVVMSAVGISINMISMVALLMAIGILMDDAIVISESIATESDNGKPPLQAVVDGTRKVARGVLSSYITSAMLFGSLLFLKGDLGQIMRVLPMVLLSVLTVSLIEAFLILPHHLKHSIEHHREHHQARWRLRFDATFEQLRARVGRLSEAAIRFRYLTVGGAFALFIISVSLIPAGIIKFKSFPDLEGNLLDARVLMPAGTPLHRTEDVVATLIDSLQRAQAQLPPEPDGDLITNMQISYSVNADAAEEGPHVATISLDLLDAEKRQTSLNELRRLWLKLTPPVPEAVAILVKEPAFGPAGQAISIRLQGHDLNRLSQASWQLQNWLVGYPGVSNIMDDLRPGTPQFNIQLQPGTLTAGIDAQRLSSQLRAAYQGVTVDEVYRGREAYEINVKLDSRPDEALADLERLTIFSQEGVDIPLVSIATIEPTREFSRIVRINHQRTVTISGDIDAKIANTNEVISDTRHRFLPELRNRYPDLFISLEGEVKNSRETNTSVLSGFILGVVGVYLLLSLQSRNYREPCIVLMNIPLALIGVIWGHWLMGLDLTMPSMIGFVSLAGIVVNDSILLVEYVKLRVREGMELHAAAAQSVRDRFRAVFLTSITTVAGMFPLLSETSLQAQVLVPLVASVVFGMVSATGLTLMVLPASYAILEDLKFVEIDGEESPAAARAQSQPA